MQHHQPSITTIQRKETGIFFYTPIPFAGDIQRSIYLDFWAFFLSLAAFSLACFTGMQPHPQTFFFSAILITSFLLKRLSNNLINCAKKIAYILLDSNSFNLCCTMLNSFLSSSSYFFRDSKFDLSDLDSLNFPVPLHPHVHTSVNNCRQFSMAFSSIE